MPAARHKIPLHFEGGLLKSTPTFLAGITAAAISSAALAAPEIHGLNPADMDPSVQACQDFNLYGNGGW